jgi:hypothetical protein
MAIESLAVMAGTTVVALILFFLIRREIGTAQEKTLDTIRGMLESGHGKPYPSAAAVVTPSPAPASAGAVPEPSHARVMVVPSAPRSGGVSLPFRPSPEQVARARAAHEASGPRSGVASESPEALRARMEREEDEREEARKARLLSAGVVAPLTVRVDTELSADETALVEAYAAARRLDFETALYQLVTVGIDAMRDEPASERRPAALTTPPQGPANDAPREAPSPIPPPAAVPLDPALERRWHVLIARAREGGKNAHHCHGERCVLDACVCQCDGCNFIAALLRKARREVDGK